MHSAHRSSLYWQSLESSLLIRMPISIVPLIKDHSWQLLDWSFPERKIERQCFDHLFIRLERKVSVSVLETVGYHTDVHVFCADQSEHVYSSIVVSSASLSSFALARREIREKRTHRLMNTGCRLAASIITKIASTSPLSHIVHTHTQTGCFDLLPVGLFSSLATITTTISAWWLPSPPSLISTSFDRCGQHFSCWSPLPSHLFPSTSTALTGRRHWLRISLS